MNNNTKNLESPISEEVISFIGGEQRIFQSEKKGEWKLTANGDFTTIVESDTLVDMDSYVDGKQEWYDHMDQIKTITVGSNWRSVGTATFKNAVNLKQVKLSKNTKTIRGDAFYGCRSLTDINTEHLTSIEVQGFRDCKSLSELTIGACELGMWVFYGCDNLKKLTFTGTPKSIHQEAFRGSSLRHINVPWAEGEIKGAPWGADQAVIHYEYGTYADGHFITDTLQLDIVKEESAYLIKGKTKFFDQETGLLVINVEAEFIEESTECQVKKILYWKDSTIYPVVSKYTLSEVTKVKDGDPYILISDLAAIFGLNLETTKGKYNPSDFIIEEGEKETELYEIFTPEFTVNGYYNTTGQLITLDNAKHGQPDPYYYIHTKPENGIPVTGGDKFRMSFKYTDKRVADILFLNDQGIKEKVITNGDINGRWIQQTDITIDVPPNAVTMLLSVYNNQVFSIERIYTTKRTDLTVIKESEFVNRYLSILEENQKISHNMNYSLNFPQSDPTRYITFIVDDTRTTIDQVAKVFLEKKVPVGIAGVPSIMIYTNSQKEQNTLKTVRDIIKAGGELLAHEGTVIKSHNQYNADTMFNQFFKTKYRMEKMGFDVNGIMLAGGTGYISGQKSELTDRYVRNYYSYSDLYGKDDLSKPSPYYYPRTSLSNHKNKDEKKLLEIIEPEVKAFVDKQIKKNKWIVFILHDFNDYSQMELEIMLDYINELSKKNVVKVVNYADINRDFRREAPINVKEIKITEKQDNGKKEYVHGEYFDPASVNVTIVCQDDTEISDFKDYSVRYEHGDTLKAGDEKVTIYVPGPNPSPTVEVAVKVNMPQIKDNNCAIQDDKNDNYVSYNGQLSVNQEGELINCHKKPFRLVGMSGGDTFFDFDSVWSGRSLDELKRWGANCIRLFVMPYENYGGLPHYLGNEDKYYDNLKKIIEMFVNLDMYIDIVWAGEALNVTDADRFFERLSQDYKNCPYILYEVDNEPYAYTNAQIAAYAKNIINTIRKNSPNALILAPVSGNDPSSLLEANKKDRLDKVYENVMYSYHQYMNGQTLVNIKDRLLPALAAGIPLVVTEWSSTDAGMVEQRKANTYDEVLANNFVKMLNDYSISWFYFCFAETPWEYGIQYWKEPDPSTKRITWDSELKDESLTPSGKYIKNLLLKKSEIKSNYAVLGQLGGDDGLLKKNGIDLDGFNNIIFESGVEIPENRSSINDLSLLDVSYLQNNGVQAYFKQPENSDSRYDLHITAKDTIYFPYYAMNYFKGFTNVKKIAFHNINTSKVNTISNMFFGCKSITDLDLSLFDFLNIEYMRSTFAGMTALRNIIFAMEGKKPSTGKLRAITNLFDNDSSLENLDLSGWNTERVTEMSDAFKNLKGLKTLRLSGWKLVMTPNKQIISNVPALEHLYLENIRISPDNVIYPEALIKGYSANELFIHVAG